MLWTVRCAGLCLLAGCGRSQTLTEFAPSPRGAFPPIEWTAYGRDAGGSRFSPAAQITRENVSLLSVAWTYRSGDRWVDDRTGIGRGRFEATPLFVDGALFFATPFGTVISLDPDRGTERWRYDPGIDVGADYGDFANRGVSTWLDASRRSDAACRRRIFVAVIDARLIALDAANGLRCTDFGVGGEVDLKAGLLNPPGYKGEYEVTSPPAVIGDLVVVGSAIADNQRVDAPSGVVRAYDARSGALRWSWDPIPRQPGMAGYDTWRGTKAHSTGAANAWSVISADSARGLVFVPVGSASPDFYGGERLGTNLFSNSVVALRATTGAVVWHFQVVHHDLWDYDVPAQPVLITIRRNGQDLAAVAVATKMGHVFVLDRDTGEPLFPVEERPVPASDLPGEEAWPTQPFPVLPAPLTPERLTANDAWGVTPEEREACRAAMAGLRAEGIFTPPSLRGTLIFPGNIGGLYWGGMAWDPVHSLLVGPTNRLAFVVQQIPRASLSAEAHRAPESEFGRQAGTPYGMRRDALLSPKRIPCNPPPWGTVDAIDLATGKKKWESPYGWFPQLAAMPGYRSWGSISLGGLMNTAGALVFASGGLDEHLHAFDVETGRELWNSALPAGGNAMPMTYQTVGGRQFVVIAAGGHDKLHTTSGDYLVAFSLPGASSTSSTLGARAIANRYSGEIHMGNNGYPGIWTLTKTNGDSIAGRFDGTGTGVANYMNGELSGTFSHDSLHVVSHWTIPRRNCSGTFAADGVMANNGALIEGPVRLRASCGTHEEIGTFALFAPKDLDQP
jgi:quinoprotein glucose dehydrogenase